MTRYSLIAVLTLSALISACGGNDTKEINCDDGLKYQNRVEGKRVEVPEGLDPLEEIAEMPIPRADPNAAPPPAGQCADMPPSVG
jgi:uncharacterized lipoprotein